MKLVVGLGNPGRKYDGTRHNVGYEVVAELARRHAAGRARLAFQGEMSEVAIGAERTWLLLPHTYMNRSGGSVGAAFDFYKLAVGDVLVICDDLNLPLGKLRIRASGSAGGQKGLQDILKRLGTEDAEVGYRGCSQRLGLRRLCAQSLFRGRTSGNGHCPGAGGRRGRLLGLRRRGDGDEPLQSGRVIRPVVYSDKNNGSRAPTTVALAATTKIKQRIAEIDNSITSWLEPYDFDPRRLTGASNCLFRLTSAC